MSSFIFNFTVPVSVKTDLFGDDVLNYRCGVEISSFVEEVFSVVGFLVDEDKSY